MKRRDFQHGYHNNGQSIDCLKKQMLSNAAKYFQSNSLLINLIDIFIRTLHYTFKLFRYFVHYHVMDKTFVFLIRFLSVQDDLFPVYS